MVTCAVQAGWGWYIGIPNLTDALQQLDLHYYLYSNAHADDGIESHLWSPHVFRIPIYC